MPQVVASDRVRHEWRARIAAEYGSAAITQQLVLWMIQLGAPPDLIEAGLAIVGDELAHSRMSHEVYVAAGGTTPPVLDRDTLGVPRRHDVLELDLLDVIVRVFCLGETVAVPLFAHLRARCTEPTARAALDRILCDEVSHREFGWDVLDWLFTVPLPVATATWIAERLPAMLAELELTYGNGNPMIASDDGEMTDLDRSWGLAPPAEYASVLARTIEKDYRPRFQARNAVIQV